MPAARSFTGCCHSYQYLRAVGSSSASSGGTVTVHARHAFWHVCNTSASGTPTVPALQVSGLGLQVSMTYSSYMIQIHVTLAACYVCGGNRRAEGPRLAIQCYVSPRKGAGQTNKSLYDSVQGSTLLRKAHRNAKSFQSFWTESLRARFAKRNGPLLPEKISHAAQPLSLLNFFMKAFLFVLLLCLCALLLCKWLLKSKTKQPIDLAAVSQCTLPVPRRAGACVAELSS